MIAELIQKAFEIGMVQQYEEIAALAERVSALQPKNVLEIGSNQGGTFYLWCQLADRNGWKIAIDLPDQAFSTTEHTDTDARAQLLNSWAPNVAVIDGDSHSMTVIEQVRRLLGNDLLDFLFIDGDHSRAGVEQDWNDYRAFVRPGGLIAFHDIRDSEYHRVNGCLVHEFWRDLDLPKEEIIDPLGYWGGIGLVAA